VARETTAGGVDAAEMSLRRICGSIGIAARPATVRKCSLFRPSAIRTPPPVPYV